MTALITGVVCFVLGAVGGTVGLKWLKAKAAAKAAALAADLNPKS